MKLSRRLRRALCELVGLGIIVFDLFFWKGILAGVVLGWFLVGYLRYRRAAVLNYQASKPLREGMTLADIRRIETRYSLRKDFDTFEKHALVRPPLDRCFYYAKYERVRELLLAFGSKHGCWIDLGCGFGEDVFYIARRLSGKVVGLDIDEFKLFEARRQAASQEGSSRIHLCAGDVLHPPFAAGMFDGVLLTEVLEHLLNPEEALRVCRSLLKDEGVLILSTPSLHNLDYCMNPFFLLEKTLSLVDDRVLPPYHGLHAEREYDRKRPEPAYGIHHHFAQRRLREMAIRHGFEVLYEGSFEIEVFPLLMMEALARQDVDALEKALGPLEKILERVPLLNRFGQHLLLAARKKPSDQFRQTTGNPNKRPDASKTLSCQP